MSACVDALGALVDELDTRIKRTQCRELIIQRTVKVRFTGFETTTVANAGFATCFDDFKSLLETAWQRQRKPVRLLGVGVKLAAPGIDSQMGLF